MHLALLVPAPFDAVSGGYAYDRRMVEGLRAAGHTVDVVELLGRHPLTDDAARAAAESAWRALPADAVPVIDGLGLPAFDALADKLAARFTVGLIHHPTALETGFSEEERAALRSAERRLMPVLARVIVTSPATGDRLAADFGVAAARIHVVVPGTEDAPRCAGSSDGVCRIVSIGTVVPRKGHDVLLQSLQRLSDLNWELTIVGSEERDKVHAHGLRALADGLGIAGRVRFAGELVDGALEAEWRKADIFALATHWEGYGMAIAEALKRGLPVAVCKGGAAGDLVPPEAGVVCEPGDVEQLGKALRRLIFSKELRDYLAEHAWQAGQQLPSWDDQARAFEAALA